jgi:hypothetical protein
MSGMQPEMGSTYPIPLRSLHVRSLDIVVRRDRFTAKANLRELAAAIAALEEGLDRIADLERKNLADDRVFEVD